MVENTNEKSSDDNDNNTIIVLKDRQTINKWYYLEQEECYFDNIYISSNQIKFENGIAVGVEDNIIHSLNKNEVSLPDAIKEKIKGRDQILLLGDQIEDTFMVEEEKRDHTLRVGFLLHPKDLETFKQYFDVVLENDTSYQELGNLLFKTYKN